MWVAVLNRSTPTYLHTHAHMLLKDICIDTRSHVYACSWLYCLLGTHRHTQALSLEGQCLFSFNLFPGEQTSLTRTEICECLILNTTVCMQLTSLLRPFYVCLCVFAFTICTVYCKVVVVSTRYLNL